jgi:hypothetical protein
VLRGLGWVSFGLAVVLGALLLSPTDGTDADYRPGWTPLLVAVAVALAGRAALQWSISSKRHRRWATPLTWRLVVLATLVAAIGWSGWQAHRADVAARAQVHTAFVRGTADQDVLWNQARRLNLPTGLASISTFDGAACPGEEPQHLTVGCWSSSGSTADLVGALTSSLRQDGVSTLLWQCPPPAGGSCTGRATYRGGHVLLRVIESPTATTSELRFVVYR